MHEGIPKLCRRCCPLGGGKWLRPSRFKSGYGWIRDTVNHVRVEAKDIKKLPQQRREIERKREREGERVIERQNQGIKGRMQYAAITESAGWLYWRGRNASQRTWVHR